VAVARRAAAVVAVVAAAVEELVDRAAAAVEEVVVDRAAAAADPAPAVGAVVVPLQLRAGEVAGHLEDEAAVAGQGWSRVVPGRAVPAWAAVGMDGASTAAAVLASVRDMAADGSAGSSAEGTGIITASFHS
jgi:hypothetical protein